MTQDSSMNASERSSYGAGRTVRTVEKIFFTILFGGFLTMASAFGAQLRSASVTDDGAVACAPATPCPPQG